MTAARTRTCSDRSSRATDRPTLEVAERPETEGKLAPVDDWMVGQLRERLKAAE
jgi:hypothetical protein